MKLSFWTPRGQGDELEIAATLSDLELRFRDDQVSACGDEVTEIFVEGEERDVKTFFGWAKDWGKIY